MLWNIETPTVQRGCCMVPMTSISVVQVLFSVIGYGSQERCKVTMKGEGDNRIIMVQTDKYVNHLHGVTHDRSKG